MRTFHFRPELDVLEARVPPSDALFSLLLEPTGLVGLASSGLTESALGETVLTQRWFDEGAGSIQSGLDIRMSNEIGSLPIADESDGEPALELVAQGLGGGGPSIQSVTVNFGVLPESSLRARDQNIRFGDDPPTASLAADLDKETGLAVVPADRMNLEFDINLPFGLGRVNLRSLAFEDGSGFYDFNKGGAEIGATLYFHAQSNLPGFDNENCFLGPLSITLSTYRAGGIPFFGGIGTMVADDFTVPALAEGSCGTGVLGDWAMLGNELLGLPIKNPGDAVLTLNLLQDPAQPPG